MREAAELAAISEAGASKEQGIVKSIRGDVGFLRCATRKREVSFRLDDITGELAEVVSWWCGSGGGGSRAASFSPLPPEGGRPLLRRCPL